MAVSSYFLLKGPTRYVKPKEETETSDEFSARQKKAQLDYKAKTEQSVASGTDKLQKMVSQNADLQKGYFELDNYFNKEQHDFAVANGDSVAEDCGLKRSSPEAIGTGSLCCRTFLVGPYSEYGDKFLCRLQERLAKIPYDKIQKEFQKRILKETSYCLGRRSDVEIEIISTAEIIKREWNTSFDWKPSNAESEALKKLSLKERMDYLKKTYPESYKQDKMHTYINHLGLISQEFREATDVVLVTQRLEINGKMYAISQYLTWLHRKVNEDPIASMTGKSKVMIMHQDPLLHDETEKDIAAIFEKGIQCKPDNNIKELQNHAGLFRYTHAHALPTSQESCTIAENKECTLYRFQKYDVKYAEDKSTDLEALTSFSLGEFMEIYPSTFTLTKRGDKPNIC